MISVFRTTEFSSVKQPWPNDRIFIRRVKAPAFELLVDLSGHCNVATLSVFGLLRTVQQADTHLGFPLPAVPGTTLTQRNGRHERLLLVIRMLLSFGLCSIHASIQHGREWGSSGSDDVYLLSELFYNSVTAKQQHYQP